MFGERLDTLFTSSDKKISGFTRPHVNGFVADIFFPLWRAYLLFYGFAVEFAVYVWTVAVSATKKLRIQKYPYTCGRGLKVEQNVVVSNMLKNVVLKCYARLLRLNISSNV